jgi:hypothetical protein
LSPPPDGTAEGSRTLSAKTSGEISSSSCATLPADIDYFLQVGTVGSELVSCVALKKLSALDRLNGGVAD